MVREEGGEEEEAEPHEAPRHHPPHQQQKEQHQRQAGAVQEWALGERHGILFGKNMGVNTRNKDCTILNNKNFVNRGLKAIQDRTIFRLLNYFLLLPKLHPS
jgi:hypothetical protein